MEGTLKTSTYMKRLFTLFCFPLLLVSIFMENAVYKIRIRTNECPRL